MTISKQLYANNAKTTLSAAAAPGDVSIQVSDGSRFPIPGQGEYFLVTLEAGSNVEIVRVHGRTGNTFTGCVRAQEGTIASNFPAGARADNRVTKGTLQSFARLIDRVDEIESVDLLDTPLRSNSNSYISHDNDDGGNPIVSFKNSSSSWRFSSHRIVVATGSVATSTQSGIASTNIPASGLSTVTAGKYLIQFITGPNAGLVRRITTSTSNAVSWTTNLPAAPSTGDQFEIYQSDYSVMQGLMETSDDGLIYAILLSE